MGALILCGFGLNIAGIWVRNILGIKAQNRMQKSKHVTTSNWGNPRLNERQMLYAANDAQVALRVYRLALAAGDLSGRS